MSLYFRNNRNMCVGSRAFQLVSQFSQASFPRQPMISQKTFKILFLCTGNSARSIFGEYLIRKCGKGRFQSYSAGVNPKTSVNPYTIRVLQEDFRIDASSARSKSWDEYREVVFDFVITRVRQRARALPNLARTAYHCTLAIARSGEFKGSDKDTYNHFWEVAQQIYRRVDLLCNCQLEKLDRLRFEQRDQRNREEQGRETLKAPGQFVT